MSEPDWGAIPDKGDRDVAGDVIYKDNLFVVSGDDIDLDGNDEPEFEKGAIVYSDDGTWKEASESQDDDVDIAVVTDVYPVVDAEDADHYKAALLRTGVVRVGVYDDPSGWSETPEPADGEVVHLGEQDGVISDASAADAETPVGNAHYMGEAYQNDNDDWLVDIYVR